MSGRPPTRKRARKLNLAIAKEIRAQRIAAGISQEAAAHALGYAQPQTMHYLETGAKMVSAADLCVLAKFFGVPVWALIPEKWLE